MSLLYATSKDAALEVDESFLARLGVHRLVVPVPFLEAGGPVNVFAIEEHGGGFALFDCGIGTDEGQQSLEQQLSDHRLSIAELKRIIVSHGHVDHFGNAQTLAERSGATVFVHPFDEEKICGDARWGTQVRNGWDFFVSLGVPKEMLDNLLSLAERARPLAKRVDRARIRHLHGGETLKFAHLELEVLHMPGHTPGLLCLYSAEHQLLFADDHVLARVSPNPLLDLTWGLGADKFKALVEYMRSAQRVMQMDLRVVLPGHGAPFTNHKPLLEGLFGFYAQRQQKLLDAIRAKPSTVFELVKLLFPRVDTARLYLMLSEVVGQLEVIETRGEIRRTDETPVFRFIAA